MSWPLRTAALTVALLCTACPKQSTFQPPGAVYDARDLVGSWQDEGGAITRFALDDQAVVVSSIVDSDGEVFQVRTSGWVASAYQWIYLVPSTGYVVTTTVDSIAGDSMQTRWQNAYSEGREEMVRVGR